MSPVLEINSHIILFTISISSPHWCITLYHHATISWTLSLLLACFPFPDKSTPILSFTRIGSRIRARSVQTHPLAPSICVALLAIHSLEPCSADPRSLLPDRGRPHSLAVIHLHPTFSRSLIQDSRSRSLLFLEYFKHLVSYPFFLPITVYSSAKVDAVPTAPSRACTTCTFHHFIDIVSTSSPLWISSSSAVRSCVHKFSLLSICLVMCRGLLLEI